MRLYDVDGVGRPLLLSEEHADLLGAKERPAVALPSSSAAKAVWVDYAVAQGMDREVVSSWTKAAIVETYGA